MRFTLPDLPYDYDALEPYLDTQTMQIHHDKHHSAYTENLNKALEDVSTEFESIEELLQNLDKFPEEIRQTVRNNAGGVYNHNIFWQTMTPQFHQPDKELEDLINATFGSLDGFKVKFTDVALKRFGSGWAWLYLTKGGLELGSTPNQDNPLMDGNTIIFGVDVWEHAYYLKYQNKRADYINAWWNTVNWPQVLANYKNAEN